MVASSEAGTLIVYERNFWRTSKQQRIAESVAVVYGSGVKVLVSLSVVLGREESDTPSGVISASGEISTAALRRIGNEYRNDEEGNASSIVSYQQHIRASPGKINKAS